MSSNHLPENRLIFLLIPLVAGLLLSTGCEKDHWLDFTKSTGKEVTVIRPVNGDFAKISLNDGLDLVITTGMPYSIRITGGENILSGIKSEIKDSTLTLSNENTFNWVRSYDKKITAYVSLPHLLVFNYNSTGTVTCTDTIREDSIFINSYSGSGIIRLILDTRLSHMAINKGSVDMEISGKSNVNFIYSGGYGVFKCSKLQTVFTFMRTSSPNDCYINVSHQFEYEILNIGNIYYKGTPDIVKGSTSGGGKIIPQGP